jgi:hypothetical protein
VWHCFIPTSKATIHLELLNLELPPSRRVAHNSYDFGVNL